MISDILHDAIIAIDEYLENPAYHGIYGQEGDYLYGVIASAVDEMRHARLILDTPPVAHAT